MNAAVRLLARRSLRAHRKAWAAVFAAVALTSVLLGASALTIGSAALGHARVDRYAAATVVVTADQSVRHTAKRWGSKPETARAALTERVRLPERTVDLLRSVEGVRDAVADQVVALTVDGRRAEGRPWTAAALAPYTLSDGRAPRQADEAVAGAGLGTRARTGERIEIRTAGQTRTYRIVGTAPGPATLYLSTAEARRLAGRPGAVDAIGVLAAPGVSTAALHSRVRHALDRAEIRDLGAGQSPRALTGDGRGAAEHLAVAPARQGLIAMVAAISGTILIVALLVLGSLVAQALRQRAGELALVRAVGATPRQIRAAVGREVVRVGAVAALLGAVCAVPAHLALSAWLRSRGVLPDGLELAAPWWLMTGSLATAALTVGAVRLVVPFARTGEPSPARPGDGRRITGLILLAGGASAAGTATLQSGQAAAAMIGTATVTMVAGCAVLGPWIARGALALLGRPLRGAGPAGRLAAAASRANAARLGAAITPIVLMTAFAAVQLSAGATMQRAGDGQADRALRAEYAVTGAEAAALRGISGVAVATDILRSTVVLADTVAGTPELARLPVLGVTPASLTRTLDPDVVSGSLDGLRRPGTVAVGADRAEALELRPGSTVRLRMGDGVQRRLTVAAVYERSLAVGDFLFSRDELARHMTAPAPARVLLATAPGTDPGALRAAVSRVAGAWLDTDPAPERLTSEEDRAGSALSVVGVAAIGGLTAVTVLTTLALITAGRRDELVLLRRVGAGRRQLRAMLRAEVAMVTVTGLTVGTAVAFLPLLAFALTAADTLPYLPSPQAAAIGLTTVTIAYAGALIPARRSLRRE